VVCTVIRLCFQDRQKGMFLWSRVPILARRMTNFPHPEEMKQAISKFLDGIPAVLAAVESKRYEQLQKHLALLPVPEAKKISAMMLKRFTPSELLLYKVASEHMYISVHTST
jgi:hypothetical protein